MQSTSFPPDYAELDCISNFSFLTGASHPEELVERAAQLGYQALALADICSLAGVVRAWIRAREHGIKLIVGSRFTLHAQGCGQIDLIVLARNLEGYGNLAQLITLSRNRNLPKGQYRLNLDDLLEPPADYTHLRGLPHCLAILKPCRPVDASGLDTQLDLLRPVFGQRLWLGLTQHHHAGETGDAALLRHASQKHGVPLLALGGVSMHVRSRQPLLDTLTAIRLGKPLQACGHALSSNAEHHMRSRARLSRLYPADALHATLEVSRLCTFDLQELHYQYPLETVPAGLSPAQYLRQATYEGARSRYPEGLPSSVRAQLESELAIISGLHYEAYFLTVHAIVQFARSRGILCQGRGSAANSAVCYCLGITEVDPEGSNNLFARFISTARNEPPDIDVDFEHDRREEVIQHIYDKYGRHRAALTAVVITYRMRSALRDTGKALGVDAQLIERVIRSCRYWDRSQGLAAKLAEHGLPPSSRLAQLWASLAQTLHGFPRHLSQHPGGFVIARDHLSRLVPIEQAAMPGRSVVQWDKDDLDAMKMLKVDVLALGMLSALRRAYALVGLRRGRPFGASDIPSWHGPTYDMICRADTQGVFQIESRAQMSMLPRLRPRTFYDLVIQIAIVRPGPIQGGMVHPYLQRRHSKEVINYPPGIEQVLGRTLGVPIFQEQAMQIAITAGGFTPDEADQLRRSMAAWRRRGGMHQMRDKLIQGMLANGHTQEYAEALFRQLEGFGEYGFPESHSASFAKLAYLSAYLKCEEPEAFLAALLNSQPMGFYSPSQLVQDARRHGVVVLEADVTASFREATLVLPTGPWRPGERAPAAVRLGLNQIKGLSHEAALRIEAARALRPYADVHDLALRAALDRHAMQALAAADALRTLSGHRHQAHWQAASLPLSGLLREAPLRESDTPELLPPTLGQEVMADYRSLGLSLRTHPLALLRRLPALRPYASAAALATLDGRRSARACGLVTVRQRPQTAQGVVFVSIEDETGTVNVLVRPELAERQRGVLLQSRLMGVQGTWQARDGVTQLIARRLVNLNPLLAELPVPSRDFH